MWGMASCAFCPCLHLPAARMPPDTHPVAPTPCHPCMAPSCLQLPVSYKLDRLEEGGDLVAGSAAPLLVRLDSGEAAAVAAAAAAEAQAQAARASGSGGGTPLQRRA